MIDRPARAAFAAFLDRLATGVATPGEWEEQAVAHHADDQLERRRRDTVRVLLGSGAGAQPDTHQASLLAEWARELRC